MNPLLPRPMTPHDLRGFQLTETFIELDSQGGPIRLSMDGTRSKPTGLAKADGSWLSYGDGYSSSSLLHSAPTDPVAAWKRWINYAKADLTLTSECFEIRKAKLLNQSYDQSFAYSPEWRKVYGDEPSDAEEMLKLLAARVRECRETVANLEAVTPTPLREEQDRKRRLAEEQRDDERRRQERLSRILAINV